MLCVLIRIASSRQFLWVHIIQSNFNGSNTFGTMKISLRQGQFEPVRVDESARSGGIIRISLVLFNMKVCCVFSLESPQMNTQNIPFSI